MLRVVGRNIKEDRRSLILGITIGQAAYLIAHPDELLVADFTDLGESIEISFMIAENDDALAEFDKRLDQKNQETRQ